MENERNLKSISVRIEQIFISTLYQKFCAIYETLLQTQLRASTIGVKFDQFKFEEYRNFCIFSLTDIFTEIENSGADRNSIASSALAGVFSTQPKEAAARILVCLWWVFNHFKIPLQPLVYYFCITADITHSNVDLWESATNFLLENSDKIDNKEFRKLFFIYLEKGSNLSNAVFNTNKTASMIANFIGFVSIKGLVPRVLVLNQLEKQRLVHRDYLSPITQVFNDVSASFRALKIMMTTFKRSLHLPVTGVSNLSDIIWMLDEKTLLFRAPYLQHHFHSSISDIPEYDYLQAFMLKYSNFSNILALFDMNDQPRPFSSLFCDCLKKIIEYIFAFEDVRGIDALNHSLFYNYHLKILYDIVGTAALRNVLLVSDMFRTLRAVLSEFKKTATLQVIFLYLIYETVSMTRLVMTIDQMVEAVTLLEEIIGKDLETESDFLKRPILLISATCAWKQVQTILNEEHSWIESKIPACVAYAISMYEEDPFDFYDYQIFHPNFISHINMYSTRSHVPNAYFEQICSIYSGQNGIEINMPRGLMVKIDPDNSFVDRNLLLQIRTYPLSQLLVYIIRIIDEKSSQDPTWIIPPPWLEIIHVLTLSSRGNFYILYHNIGSILKKLINKKIYNSLSLILEEFTYRPVVWDNINSAIFVFENVLAYQQICASHREMCVYFYCFIFSFFMRLSKFDQSFNPSFYIRIAHYKIPSHFPDVSIYFIWNMIQGLNMMGFRQNIDPILVEYTRNIIKQCPHTWTSFILSKCPSDISILYEDITDYDPEELMASIASLKASLTVKLDESTRFIQLFQQQIYQNIILCLILDRLLGETMDDNFIFSAYKRISNINISYAIRTMIFYIIMKKYDVNVKSMSRVTEVIEEMIWKLQLFTIDQFIFSLLTFYNGNNNLKSILHLLIAILKCNRFQSALRTWVSLTPNSPSINTKIEASSNFYKNYSESFDFTEMNKILNLSEDHQRPYPPPLAIFFNNIFNRMGFYTDMIVYRTLEHFDDKYIFEKMLKTVQQILNTHPCPIHSILMIFIFHHEHLEKCPSDRFLLMNTYLQQKYKECELKSVFSDTFIAYQKNFTDNFNDRILFMHWHIQRIAYCLSMSAFECHEAFSDTLEEFSGNHLVQFLTCSSLEILATTSSRLFTQLFWDVYVDPRISVLNMPFIYDPEHIIRTFGLILSLLPKEYFLGVISNTNKYIIKIKDLTMEKDFPSFLDFEINGKKDEIYNNQTTLLLLLIRSFFEHLPIGYLCDLPSLLVSNFSCCIINEAQFLFMAAAVFPCLRRLDKQPGAQKIIKNIGVILSNMLKQALNQCQKLHYPTLVSDFFYLLKYTYLGENISELVAYFSDLLTPEMKEYFKLL